MSKSIACEPPTGRWNRLEEPIILVDTKSFKPKSKDEDLKDEQIKILKTLPPMPIVQSISPPVVQSIPIAVDPDTEILSFYNALQIEVDAFKNLIENNKRDPMMKLLYPDINKELHKRFKERLKNVMSA
jgi:hypothetical protein